MTDSGDPAPAGTSRRLRLAVIVLALLSAGAILLQPLTGGGGGSTDGAQRLGRDGGHPADHQDSSVPPADHTRDEA